MTASGLRMMRIASLTRSVAETLKGHEILTASAKSSESGQVRICTPSPAMASRHQAPSKPRAKTKFPWDGFTDTRWLRRVDSSCCRAHTCTETSGSPAPSSRDASAKASAGADAGYGKPAVRSA